MTWLCKFISIFTTTIIRKRWRRFESSLIVKYRIYLIIDKNCIPFILQKAIIAAEDRRFFNHGGIDFISLGRVIVLLCKGNKLQGASTIEQQLVRVITGNYARTIKRKIVEMLLAVKVCKVVPKSDIPGLYLSIAYFGWRMNGLNNAYRRLSYQATSLTAQQASQIVARLKYPEPKNPSERIKYLIERRARYIESLIKD